MSGSVDNVATAESMPPGYSTESISGEDADASMQEATAGEDPSVQTWMQEQLEAFWIPLDSPYWKTFERVAGKGIKTLAVAVDEGRKPALHECAEGNKTTVSRDVTNRIKTIVTTSKRRGGRWEFVDMNEDAGDALLSKIGLRWADPHLPEDERIKLVKGYGVDAILYGLDRDGKISYAEFASFLGFGEGAQVEQVLPADRFRSG